MPENKIVTDLFNAKMDFLLAFPSFITNLEGQNGELHNKKLTYKLRF
jgi:hypothetical protein